jgi:two-component system OmpR family sensor kinase
MTSVRRRIHLQPLRNWTLRARIIASLIGLLIVLCLAIGTFTELALSHFLMNRLDGQLTAARDRVSVGFAANPNQPPPRDGDEHDLLPPGAAVGTIGARFTSSGGTAQLQDGRNRDTLSTTVTGQLRNIPQDGEPYTVDLSGLGHYRASATVVPDGDVLVTALPLSGVRDTLRNLTLVITGLSLVGLVIAGIAGAWIVRLALRPLRRVTSTASRVAEMQLDEGEVALAVRVPEPNPHTEVGQVGVALNRMLENVSDALNARHASETRVRQFVADASHELRTPLASIRGYAELTRRSRDQAPPDIAHAMSRVESEAARMTALVEDLLLLARLDAGRPLDRAEVDLTMLAVDAISDAHAAGRDHLWHLELPDEPVTVVGDDARLRQVLANILANARTHTPPGTNVWLSLAEAGDSAELSVRDDGPGIPADLIPDIFQRFSRGEESRSRTAGSTGLGLAIVAAVVAAHHGEITLASEPGETVFTVRLPMHGGSQGASQSAARFTDQRILL